MSDTLVSAIPLPIPARIGDKHPDALTSTAVTATESASTADRGTDNWETKVGVIRLFFLSLSTSSVGANAGSAAAPNDIIDVFTSAFGGAASTPAVAIIGGGAGGS